MRGVLAVFLKEVLDNQRDRQSVYYALLFGPVLVPLLIGGAFMVSLSQTIIDYEEITDLHVIDQQHAPSLINFLYKNNLDIVDAEDTTLTQLEDGEIDIVLEIPDNYGELLQAGKPAPLTLHVNEGSKNSLKALQKVHGVLSHYEQILANLRLQIRGLNPRLFDTLAINTINVSSDKLSGQVLLSMLPFLFIISMVMGGFYLAIDTTAGERDRQSLEPLLSLPIQRWQVTLGKYLATLFFIAVSALLTALTILLLFNYYPDNPVSARYRFDPLAIGKSLLLISPLMLLITGFLITVSAYTRSTKEAQTYLGLLMVIPMAPFFILQFFPIKSAVTVMMIPMLSQYKLLEKVVKNEVIPWQHVTLSVCTTLLGALLLLKLAFWLYRQDRILR